MSSNDRDRRGAEGLCGAEQVRGPNRTQKDQKEPEPLQILPSTERPAGQCSSALPGSSHGAPGDSDPGLVVISDGKDARREGHH